MLTKLPITNIGDPYVLKVEDKYYLYATSAKDGFLVWTSDDLLTWSEPIKCYEKSSRSFGNKNFWAPEVYLFNDKYYMYYTANWNISEKEKLRIGVATSDSPIGPFIDYYDNQPMFDFKHGALDAHILTTYEGEHYLYFSSAMVDNKEEDGNYAYVEVVKLGKDFVSIVGEPVQLIKSEFEYEKKNSDIKKYWAEGPFIIKHNGLYHLMYSANFFASEYYCLCGAVSESPMGPFKKYANNPILKKNAVISGPGHNSVTEDKDGNLTCVFHAHTHYDKPSGDRQVYLAPLRFQDEQITIEIE